MKHIIILLGTILLFGCTARESAHNKLQDELKEVVLQNTDAWNSKDFPKLKETIHLDSDLWRRIKRSWDIELEIDSTSKLKSISLIGIDGAFAVVRCLFDTTDSIRNSDVDKIIVFHKEKDKWLIWSLVATSYDNLK
jgi:hypothetical protein